MQVREIMAHPATTISQDASLAEAAKAMLDNGVGCLPVVDDEGNLVGIITESTFSAKSAGVPFSTFRAPQILGRWLSEEGIEQIYHSAREIPVRDVMVRSVIGIAENDSVATAVELMLKYDINRIPVVRDGKPVGVIARHDLLRMLVVKGQEQGGIE